MEMENNALIRANLIAAMQVIASVPSEQVNLETFKRESPSCGTVACLAGWLAQDSRFQEQGMRLASRPIKFTDKHSWWLTNAKTTAITDGEHYSWPWLDKLFGEAAFERLFEPYGQGAFDQDFLSLEIIEALRDDSFLPDDAPSDKALAIERLKRQLALYPETTANS